MRRWMNRLLGAVAGMPLAMGGVASAAVDVTAPADEAAWADTLAQGTLEGFAKFALEYPDSMHADEARAQLVTAALPAQSVEIYSSTPGASEPEFIPGSLMVV